MPFSETQQALEDILENIARIERFAAGHDINTFRHDGQALFSTQYALLVISEASRRLGDQAETCVPTCRGRRWRALATGCATV